MATAKKLTTKAAAQDMQAFAAALRARIESEVSGFSADPKAVAKRRNAMREFGFFNETYFPHYIRSPHRSKLQGYLYDRLPQILDTKTSCSDAIAAPRGEAKSTLVSQLFVLWCIVTGRKKYPVIVMDSIDQAYPMLEAIKAELEFNPRLKTDFPEACGQGRVWQAATILTNNGTKVQVAGSGKKLRGLRHGPYRPDLCVLDDIENDENVQKPEQRDKLQGWLNKTVMKLGGADAKFDVIYIGTILHHDSVLNRVLSNKLWVTKRFKSIIHWPVNLGLWDEWEEILRNDGEEAADRFYAAHRFDMLEGSEVSWVARPLLELMKIRARDGHASFDSEHQNDPTSGDDNPFSGEGVIKFWAHEPSDPCVYFGAVDPSLGKAGASRDPSAILVGRMNRKTQVLDVVVANIKKRLPDRIIEDVIALQKRYQCILWVVESVQFQEFLRTELIKRGREQGVPIPARAVTPSTDKLLRIESLQPYIANGEIRLHVSQVTLIDQLKHFPKADHDDGPDALQMLWAAAKSGTVTYNYEPVGGGKRGAFKGGGLNDEHDDDEPVSYL